MGALNIVGACCGKPTNGPGSGLPPCLQRAKDGGRFNTSQKSRIYSLAVCPTEIWNTSTPFTLDWSSLGTMNTSSILSISPWGNALVHRAAGHCWWLQQQLSRSEALTASSPNSPCLDRTRHTGHQDASNGNIVIQSRQSSTWGMPPPKLWGTS